MFKQTTQVFCGDCDKYIPSEMPWICGHCGAENQDTRKHSFLKDCKQCKKKPRAFVCPHCLAIWCLDEDSDGRNPARLIQNHSHLPSPPKIEAVQEKQRRIHAETLEETRRKIEEAKLELELKILEEKKRRVSGKSPRELLIEELENGLHKKVGIREWFRIKKAYIEKTYPKESDSQEDWLLALDQLEREQP